MEESYHSIMTLCFGQITQYQYPTDEEKNLIKEYRETKDFSEKKEIIYKLININKNPEGIIFKGIGFVSKEKAIRYIKEFNF